MGFLELFFISHIVAGHQLYTPFGVKIEVTGAATEFFRKAQPPIQRRVYRLAGVAMHFDETFPDRKIPKARHYL